MPRDFSGVNKLQWVILQEKLSNTWIKALKWHLFSTAHHAALRNINTDGSWRTVRKASYSFLAGNPYLQEIPSPVIWVGLLFPSVLPHSTFHTHALQLHSLNSCKEKEQNGSFSLPSNEEKLCKRTKQCIETSYPYSHKVSKMLSWRLAPAHLIEMLLAFEIAFTFIYIYISLPRYWVELSVISSPVQGSLIYICQFQKPWVTLWFTACPRRDRRP